MRIPRCAAALLCIAAFAFPTFAQSNKGTITGTITDPNGALVKDATITATNTETGEARTATTSDDGTYSIPALDPGEYRVRIEGAGFQPATVERVRLETNARQPVDAQLTVGGVGGDTVIVTAEAPLVESETSVRGDVITGRQVVDLPIPQRNFTLLAALSPGVTRPVSGVIGGGGQFSGNSPVGNSTESTRFRESGGSVISANGARVTNNNFTLDGVDNNESQFGQIGIYPNPDAIAEFKVETSVPSAESGRAGGAIISTTFKSGTNAIHGTLYEFYQGRFGSAKPTNNANPPNYVTHNFGGTVGGPVFLPRFGEGGPMLYDGRNQTFFFFSYNGQRNGTPAFGGGEFNFVTVPTAKMRAGDFSEFLEPGNLRTFNTVAGPRVAPRGTVFDRNGNPYPGNIIPAGDLNPVAVSYFNAFPLPTGPGRENNFRRNRAERSNVDGYDIKIDHNFGLFGASTSLFGRYSKSENGRLRDNNFPLGSSPNGNDLASGFGAGNEFGNSRQVALGMTTSFTPTVINDARAGYTRVEIGIFNPGVGGALGFSPSNAADLGSQRTNNCGLVCTGRSSGRSEEQHGLHELGREPQRVLRPAQRRARRPAGVGLFLRELPAWLSALFALARHPARNPVSLVEGNRLLRAGRLEGQLEPDHEPRTAL
ncbi:MAG: carboxypeptidase-like regulatory domain-containing protein [Acidobacteria bacterium]|nr:carboxypeptidase-like regulatory domain-containing protein [Acidobacteriota bacterium]